MNNEGAPRYSLILESVNGTKYCYNANNDCFILMYPGSIESKTTLSRIDVLTTGYYDLKTFASIYGIAEDVKRAYIKYMMNGENFIAPVFNNKTWHHIAKNYDGKKIDFRDETNLNALHDIYFELTNKESSFADLVINNPNKTVKICQKTKDEIISLVAHENAINRKIRLGNGIKDRIYSDDKTGFYIDLRRRLSNYRDFRSIYLNYCKYIKKQEEIKKDEESKPKKKVLVPYVQLSMFD